MFNQHVADQTGPATKQVVERRLQLLRSAAEVFATVGFGRARMEDIAAHAGVSAGLVYHYFVSKEALYEAVLLDAVARMEAAIPDLNQLAGSPAEKIRALIDRYHNLLEPHPELPRLLLDADAMETEFDSYRPRLEALRQQGLAWVDGLAPGGHADAEEFLLLALSGMLSWFAPTPFGRILGADPNATPTRAARHKAALTELLVAALGVPSATSEASAHQE